jgi:hypothetical protein
MSIESKAKTTNDIYVNAVLDSDMVDTPLNGLEKWVPLEEAQQLEQSRDFFKDKWNIAMDRLITYEKQVADLKLQLEVKEGMKNLLTDCIETRAEQAESERDRYRQQGCILHE